MRAIIVIHKRSFQCVFQRFSCDKMTLCNNNDQTCFSDVLTYARPLRSRYNPRLSGSGFNTTLWVQQMLIHRKTCLIPIVINWSFTIRMVSFADFNDILMKFRYHIWHIESWWFRLIPWTSFTSLEAHRKKNLLLKHYITKLATTLSCL